MIAALLSYKMAVRAEEVMSSLLRRDRSQIASFEHLKAAIYSALQEEMATVFYFLELQETMADPKVNKYPPTLHLVSRQLA